MDHATLPAGLIAELTLRDYARSLSAQWQMNPLPAIQPRDAITLSNSDYCEALQ